MRNSGELFLPGRYHSLLLGAGEGWIEALFSWLYLPRGEFPSFLAGTVDSKWVMVQMPQLIFVTRIWHIILNKHFFICYVPLGTFPEIFN